MVDKSEKFRWLVQLGFAARGVVYVLIGYLALSTAGGDKGPEGAFNWLQDAPLGIPVLYLAALGLLAYALYRLSSLVFDVDNHGTDGKGVAYRIGHGATVAYARDDAHRDELLATTFKGKKPEIGRFKGLGEMMPAQLKETTMDPSKRTLARVTLPRAEESVEELVEKLMGKKADQRFRFIQENAEFAVADVDI